MNLHYYQPLKANENNASPVFTLTLVYVITLISIILWTAMLITILYFKSTPNKSNPIIYVFSCLFGDFMPQILKRHCKLLNMFNINDKLSKPELSKRKFASKVSTKTDSQNKIISLYRPTLKFLVESSSGQFAVARALLDTGSAYSYISPQLVQRINCSTRLIWPIYVSRFCGQPSEIIYQTATNVKLHSTENLAVNSNCLEFLIDFETDESKRTCRAPSKSLASKLATSFGINLSDNESQDASTSPHYDLLIGQDILHSEVLLSSMNVVKLTKDLSILKTKFGCAVMGRWNDQTEFDESLDENFENASALSVLAETNEMELMPAPMWMVVLVILPSTFIFLHLVLVVTIFTLALPILLFIHKIFLHLTKIGEVFLSLYFSLSFFSTEFFFTFISPYVKLPSNVTKYHYDQIPYSYQPTVYAFIENSQYPNRSLGASILLDTGSIYSYICSSLAQQLNCKVVTYGARKAVWVKLKSFSTLTELEVLLWIHESLQFKHCPRPSSQISKIVNRREHGTVIQREYCSFKTYNVIIGSDLLSSVLSHSTANVHKIHHNLVAHPCRLGWVVQGANLNLASPWNALQNKTCFNLEAHFVNKRKLTSLWLFCLALFWLDCLPIYFKLK